MKRVRSNRETHIYKSLYKRSRAKHQWVFGTTSISFFSFVTAYQVVDVDNMSDHEFEAFGSVTDDASGLNSSSGCSGCSSKRARLGCSSI